MEVIRYRTDTINATESNDAVDGVRKRKNVYCVDYSVGQLHKEREVKPDEEYHGKLAALRYPEWEVHHDDGTVIPIE